MWNLIYLGLLAAQEVLPTTPIGSLFILNLDSDKEQAPSRLLVLTMD